MGEPLKVVLQPFQERFFLSTKRYPAFISGVGTGKTLIGLLKVWTACEKHPKSLWLIVRNEYTDLRDSTIKDFSRYFGVTVNSNKEYKFNNGSVIMFRHGAEINVLKNITLDGYLMEQAEEFPTDEQFTFLRDRLRGRAGEKQQGCIIANANGHNWVWDKWVNTTAVDGSFESTRYCQPVSSNFEPTLARTMDNQKNLPPPYVRDLLATKSESPNHFQQYVLNDFSTEQSDDSLFSPLMLSESVGINFAPKADSDIRRIMGVDVARYGGNEIVYSVLESRGPIHWEQIHQECYIKKGMDETIGRTLSLIADFNLSTIVIDDDGIGGGLVDMIRDKENVNVIAYRGGLPMPKSTPEEKPRYDMTRSYSYFLLQEAIQKKHLKILDDKRLHQQLLSLRYSFRPNGSKHVISKEEMRKNKTSMLDRDESPDRSDALMMAYHYREEAGETQNTQAYAHAIGDIPSNHGIHF